MNIIIKPEYATELAELFEAYKGSGLNADASYTELRGAVKIAEPQLSPVVKQYITSPEFKLSPDIFRITGAEQMDVFDLFIGFNNFCKTLYGAITRHRSEFATMKAVVRKPLPELKDFDYLGNNDMAISLQPSDYSLIYGA